MRRLILPSLLVLSLLAPCVQAATITETFTAADNATLTGSNTWVEQVNTNWRTFSNAAWLNTGAAGWGYTYISSATLDSGDQKVTGTVSAFLGEASADILIGPLLRSPGTSTFTGYLLQATWGGAGVKDWKIYKMVAATPTELATNAQDPAAGDTFEFTVTQNGANVDLVAKVNGIQIMSVTDSSSPISASNHNVGLAGYCVVVSSVNNAVDTLTYSDYSVAASGASKMTLTGVGN